MSFWKKLVQKFVPGITPDSATPADVETEIDWEALLLEADLGLTLTQKWTAALTTQKLLKKPLAAEQFLRAEMLKLLEPPAYRLILDKPEVIMLVGVNGSGKTTSAAKLTQRSLNQGKTVMLGACDTFRAAAVDQLQVWGERLAVPVISGPPGRDPASVAFESYERAEKEGTDLLIIDTAGRMPNKNNLMQEIMKVKRVLAKKSPDSPHHTWLVVDGTTGNNVLFQAQEFHQTLQLTGLIVTKMDSSAKGGMIAAVRAELGVPTLYIGRGEQASDLESFEAHPFVESFFGK